MSDKTRDGADRPLPEEEVHRMTRFTELLSQGMEPEEAELIVRAETMTTVGDGMELFRDIGAVRILLIRRLGMESPAVQRVEALREGIEETLITNVPAEARRELTVAIAGSRGWEDGEIEALVARGEVFGTPSECTAEAAALRRLQALERFTAQIIEKNRRG